MVGEELLQDRTAEMHTLTSLAGEGRLDVTRKYGKLWKRVSA
jgi:hypothetical protein